MVRSRSWPANPDRSHVNATHVSRSNVPYHFGRVAIRRTAESPPNAFGKGLGRVCPALVRAGPSKNDNHPNLLTWPCCGRDRFAPGIGRTEMARCPSRLLDCRQPFGTSRAKGCRSDRGSDIRDVPSCNSFMLPLRPVGSIRSRYISRSCRERFSLRMTSRTWTSSPSDCSIFNTTGNPRRSRSIGSSHARISRNLSGSSTGAPCRRHAAEPPHIRWRIYETVY